MSTAPDTSTNPSAPTASLGTEDVVAALSGLWRAVQVTKPEVPDVVLMISAGSSSRHGVTDHGHYASSKWIRRDQAGAEQLVGEVKVSGEGLVRGSEKVLATVLHEAAHALAEALGIKDTSRQGKYHNTRFRDLAQGLGLDVAEAGNNGWCRTTATADTLVHYQPQLDDLTAALTVYRVPDKPSPAGTAPSTRLLKVICGCAKPRPLRVSKSVFDLGGITCKVCGEDFVLSR